MTAYRLARLRLSPLVPRDVGGAPYTYDEVGQEDDKS
jgi:hypothetical protein